MASIGPLTAFSAIPITQLHQFTALTPEIQFIQAPCIDCDGNRQQTGSRELLGLPWGQRHLHHSQ